MNMENITSGLWVSLYGLTGVFTVLILFYLLTKLMVSVSRRYSKKEQE